MAAMMKKLLPVMILILFGIMVFANICVSATSRGEYMTEIIPYSPWIYDTVNGNVTIAKCDSIATGEMVIPETFDGYPVNAIGDGAFKNCFKVTSVTIPVGVTSIGNKAFMDCTNLTDVYYGGTGEVWESVNIGKNNEPLLNATIHFISSGDANEDWEVNIKDVISIRQFIADGYNIELSEKIVDLNKDSVVDIKDVIMLRQFIAGGYGVEL